MNDADLELLRATTPAWDELREQRVLGRVEAELAAAPIVARAPTASRTRWLPAALAAAAVVLSTGAGATWWLSQQPDAEHPAEAVIASTEDGPGTAPEPSTLRLPDGSVAQMDARAHVDVEVQTDALVRLLQTQGAVRYDVSRNANREFVVDVGDVRVRVLGTAFTITRAGTMMSVEVHHGRVEVRRGARRTELGKGETLSMEVRERGSADDGPLAAADIDAASEGAETGEADLIVVDDSDEVAGRSAGERPKAARRSASANTLLLRADEARADGRLADAASALRELVRHHNKDTQAYSAWFQLGKVERARGRHGAAAAAFARCAKRSPQGALSEDARAEAAASWRAAGKTKRAYEAAQTYLTRHPQGTHAARMQRILASRP